MALVLGTNCGFVTTAPTGDPGGLGQAISSSKLVVKATSPTTAVRITEIGWYTPTATDSVNFMVGLYSADGEVVPGEAGTRLYLNDTNAKGTTAGWKSVSVDWEITEETIYWLAVQTAYGSPTIDYQHYDGDGRDWLGGNNLTNPFGGGALGDADGLFAVYVVWEAATTGTNTKINIGDSWKDISAMQINIGDVWKVVEGAQINIGDTWKTIF